jgi:hypothetical protein
MHHYLRKTSILILGFATMAAMAKSHPQDSTQSFQFKSGQSVYIVALKDNSTPDFEIEESLKHEFEKHKTFKVTRSLQSADFVFLMYVDYGVRTSGGTGDTKDVHDYIKSVTAFAVSPAIYTKHKSDPFNLRNEALWNLREKTNTIDPVYSFKRMFGSSVHKSVVKKFHQEILKNRVSASPVDGTIYVYHQRK